MNGKEDAREVLKKSLGLEEGADLVNEITSGDINKLLQRVVQNNKVQDRKIGYSFNRIGPNANAERPWSERSILKLLCRRGKYVVLGSATTEADRHIVRGISEETGEEKRVQKWCSYKKDGVICDHAIGIVVGANCEAYLVDNGLRSRVIACDVLSIVKRLSHLMHCYEFDLFEL